jgi:hypothetical protein
MASSDCGEEIKAELNYMSLLIGPKNDDSPVENDYDIASLAEKWNKKSYVPQLPTSETRNEVHTADPLSTLPAFTPGRNYVYGSKVQKEKPGLSTVLQYFFLMFDEEIIVRWVEETNNYANDTKLKEWYDVTPMEFKTFLAIVFYLGIVKLPERRMAWAKNSIFLPRIGAKV